MQTIVEHLDLCARSFFLPERMRMATIAHLIGTTMAFLERQHVMRSERLARRTLHNDCHFTAYVPLSASSACRHNIAIPAGSCQTGAFAVVCRPGYRWRHCAPAAQSSTTLIQNRQALRVPADCQTPLRRLRCPCPTAQPRCCHAHRSPKTRGVQQKVVKFLQPAGMRCMLSPEEWDDCMLHAALAPVDVQ